MTLMSGGRVVPGHAPTAASQPPVARPRRRVAWDKRMCEWQAPQAAEEHKMYKPSWLARILLRRVEVVADYSLSVTGRQSFEMRAHARSEVCVSILGVSRGVIVEPRGLRGASTQSLAGVRRHRAPVVNLIVLMVLVHAHTSGLVDVFATSPR